MQKVSGMFLLTVLFSGSLFSSFAFAQEGPIAEDDFYTVDEATLFDFFEQIQLIFDKFTLLEDEITQLKEENALLEKRISILESFHSDVIVSPSSKTNVNGNNEKITICHKGKNTITISVNALHPHLNHGDTRGKCLDDLSSNSFSTYTTTITPQTNFFNERADICHNGKVTLSLPGNAARHHLEHHSDDFLGQCNDNFTSSIKAEREAERLAKQESKEKGPKSK